MRRARYYRALLTVVYLLTLTGQGALVAAGTPTTPRRSAAPNPALCRWASRLPAWLTNPLSGLEGPTPIPLPSPTVPPNSPVQYARVPSQAYRVLVDQPTGTIFALSDNGLLLVGLASGLLTVLQGATRTPPGWFPTTPPAGGGTDLLGMVVPVADGQGHVYFTCGGGLYQLDSDGRPQPVPIRGLPLPNLATQLPFDVTAVIDEPLQRLFTLAGNSLQGFNVRTGRQVLNTYLPTVFGGGSSVMIGPLAVDAQRGWVYIPTYDYEVPEYGLGPTALYILNVQGRLVRKLLGLGSGVGASQLILAGSTRRLIVFGCDTVFGGATPGEHVQVLNLTTGRYLTPRPLTLGACGGPQTGSLLRAATPGILAVDAGAGTGVVVSATWAPMNPPAPPYPGFAWFVNLRTGSWLSTGTAHGCVQVGKQPSAVAIDSHLHRAYVASSADGLVTVLDTRTGHVLGVVHVGGTPTSITVDTHDNRVVVALEGLPGQTGTPGGVAFFPADITTGQVPPTLSCAAEGAPFQQVTMP